MEECVAEILLKTGQVVLVDDEVLAILPNVSWRLHKGYVRANFSKDSKTFAHFLHRFVIGAKPGQIVDHINRNPLDNRRCNLRFCTRAENARNRSKSKGKLSKFLGVTFHKHRRKWMAQINGTFIGYFHCEEMAARAYDREAMAIYGEFASINLPRAAGAA
jgi:hypothetical protein